MMGKHLGSRAQVPTLSVIIPVHNSNATIDRCLSAVLAAVDACDEVIVVDDGSTDGWRPPPDDRVHWMRLESNIGRGPARNVGARRASADVTVFVDADVAIRADALEAIRTAFLQRPGRSCLIGAYDDRPADARFVSQYRNLLHHRTHLTHGAQAVHFWTGIGAVRRDVFHQVGGLDETDWAHDMEDVEFGHRLVDAGFTIDVLPHIQGTHLKRFSIRSMLTTDLFHRALPWSSLMFRSGFRRNDFVLSVRQAVSVAAALSVVAAIVARAAGRLRTAAVLPGALVFVGVNTPLWAFFRDKRGWWFALGCMPLHLLHSLTSAAGFAMAGVVHVARSAKVPLRRRAEVQPPPPESGANRR